MPKISGPFGRASKVNSYKAQTSRVISTIDQDTLKTLGIVNKSGRKRVIKDKNKRRLLYEGVHEIPVFNLKLQDQPVLLQFKFTAYRTSIKIYIEGRIFLKPEQVRYAHFINRNRQLIVELSERMAIKHMGHCDNDFG